MTTSHRTTRPSQVLLIVAAIKAEKPPCWYKLYGRCGLVCLMRNQCHIAVFLVRTVLVLWFRRFDAHQTAKDNTT
eukprot:1781269-Rhodomonas_salina.6